MSPKSNLQWDNDAQGDEFLCSCVSCREKDCPAQGNADLSLGRPKVRLGSKTCRMVVVVVWIVIVIAIVLVGYCWLQLLV